MKEETIEINGLHINYVEVGTGQPIIFLHNGGGFWQTWQKQLDYFSKKYHVFGIDWPGFGGSSLPDDIISLELLTEILDSFIQNKNLKNVIIIGNCIGASAALNYANKKPLMVTKLILFNICPGDTIYPNDALRFLFRKVNYNRTLKLIVSKIIDFIVSNPPIKNRIPRILFGKNYNKNDSLSMKYIAKFHESKQTASRVNLFYSMHTFSPENFLKEKNLFKHILIWGEENKVIPLHRFGLINKKNMMSEYFEVIPEGGHLCMYEYPELVDSIILKYIENEKY